MTQDQCQVAKEILEHHGYKVILFNGQMGMTNKSHEVFRLRHVKDEGRIYILPVAGYFSADLIKRELAEVCEVLLDLQLNGVPVAM